jgi:hypothetical protein
VSQRLLKDGGLVSVSVDDPEPSPAALPAATWSGWADVADVMGLNAAHGPGLVQGMARLFAQQQRHIALLRKQRPQNPPPIAAELQRLSAMLHLAEASNNTFWLYVLPRAA